MDILAKGGSISLLKGLWTFISVLSTNVGSVIVLLIITHGTSIKDMIKKRKPWREGYDNFPYTLFNLYINLNPFYIMSINF